MNILFCHSFFGARRFLTDVFALRVSYVVSPLGVCLCVFVCTALCLFTVPITVLATRRVDADTLPPTAKGADHYEYHVHYDHCAYAGPKAHQQLSMVACIVCAFSYLT